MTYDKSTEERILDAARQVFQRKGMMGARMQEIADEAGINKAMLHYYFKSKDSLFDRVFLELVGKMLPVINQMLSSEIPLFEKIRRFVAEYQTNLAANEYVPAFVLQEMNRDPERLLAMLSTQVGMPNPLPFFKQIEEEVKAGHIRPIRPDQLMLNMISMCLFPYLVKPITRALHLDPAFVKQIQEARKTEVADFIINAIKL